MGSEVQGVAVEGVGFVDEMGGVVGEGEVEASTKAGSKARSVLKRRKIRGVLFELPALLADVVVLEACVVVLDIVGSLDVVGAVFVSPVTGIISTAPIVVVELNPMDIGPEMVPVAVD